MMLAHRACLVTLFVLVSGCASPPVAPAGLVWPESTLEAEGIDPAPVFRALDALPADDARHGLHALLMARHGRLVLERYWGGYDAATPHDLRSATKSITAMVTATAIDAGELSTEDPIASWLAADAPGAPALDAGIRVADLLHMQSGLACDDRDLASPGNEERMYLTADWVRFALGLASVRAPGAAGAYCTAGVVLLGRVVERATGMPFDRLASERLFGPMGIEGATWARFDGGRGVDTGGHLRITPRSLLALGQLLLQRGEWNGTQLLSPLAVDALAAPSGTVDGQPYGSLFWLGHVSVDGRPVELSYMAGNGGPLLFVVPSLQLVVAFTGGNFDTSAMDLPFQVFLRSILPATAP